MRMFINVMLDGIATPIDRGAFEALFEQSVVNDYADVKKALKSGDMPFRKLVQMARKAEIPYPLFFAPREVVDAQLRLKRERLLSGFSAKRELAMNSRSRVDLSDVELIVKNLQYKQALIRRDNSLLKNPIVGCLKKAGASVEEDSAKLMAALDLSPTELRSVKNKTAALELLISKLEGQHVLVAQSAKNYMPQQIPKGAIFSGMTLKDSKVPYIFIATGDEGEKFEPAGRRVFTLTLLAVLVARGRFATVSYSGHTSDETSNREYELTAEMLMPAADFRPTDLSTLDAVRTASNVFKVTPSAVVMRARRLSLLPREDADRYLADLQAAYDQAEKRPRRNMQPLNALRKYNGVQCSRRMLALYDSGGISHRDFCRVVFSNKLRSRQSVNDFRAVVT